MPEPHYDPVPQRSVRLIAEIDASGKVGNVELRHPNDLKPIEIRRALFAMRTRAAEARLDSLTDQD